MVVINRDHPYYSPNYSSRKGTPIDTIIVHHTGGYYPGCCEWLCNKQSGASAHFIIRSNGEILEMVPVEYSAWHAGRGAFDLNEDGTISPLEKYFNRRSIGIELESDGHSYSEAQLDALEGLVIDLCLQYNIPAKHILGHKEIAPDRKWDPGNFDMNAFRDKIKYALSLTTDAK
jgi:N-acetylmuramoyl-L-alanine amidase